LGGEKGKTGKKKEKNNKIGEKKPVNFAWIAPR